MDVAEMKPIQSGKAKAGVNADVAKGAALAVVCMKYATERMKAEEKEHGKLKAIVNSIGNLSHDAHVEFRAELTKELSLLRELRKVGNVDKAHTAGYSFASFEVLVSQWKTISTAVELGYKVDGKPWSLVIAEAGELKRAHASNAGEGAQLPVKRKTGRKATPNMEKAENAAMKLNDAEFKKFAAWVNKELATREASAKH
jgi:hypothetical protein